MSSNKGLKKTLIRVAAALTAVACLGSLKAFAYIDTGRDTRPDPPKAEYTIADMHSYELLYETDTMKYYYREDRDVIAVYDKRSGYTWKTGIDAPFSKELTANIKAAKTEEEILRASEPKEKNLNSTYIGIANSLLTVEYSEKETTKYTSSASETGASSKLYRLEGSKNKFRLEADFSSIDLKLNMYITFNEDAITYDIPFEEMSGEGMQKMIAVIITPFLGASGGEAEFYDPKTGSYGEARVKNDIPGYIFVPDGSGALIRFRDNNVAFNPYVGDVYGADPSTETYYYSNATDAVPVKDPVMPVFGIAHGNCQNAFVAWADKGAEYLEIIANPDEARNVKYTWGYPRFEYNMTYYQVYNNAGSGYFTLMKEPNAFDVSMTYRFLAGEGETGFRADYFGMALAYREHLIENGTLTVNSGLTGDIPMRVDFLMSDVKKSVIGTSQVVVTTVDDVREILNQLSEAGVNNVNSGLTGWQKKSETLAKPWKLNFASRIGTKAAFKSLIGEFSKKGMDISLSRDFTTINKKMVTYYTNSVKHVNTWYPELRLDILMPENAPVMTTGYALPSKTAEWLTKLSSKAADFSDSLTITGTSHILVSSYDKNGVVVSPQEAVQLIREAAKGAADEMKLNLDKPNSYLWEYTARFLNAPVQNSQYIFETDTVPFLEILLNGTMEIYGPYSNFSFYTQRDVLRMIDYNISPSFIFTKEPSYLLADTASSDMYSTEYEQYKEAAVTVYGGVNSILKEVRGYDWIGREVLQSGVIKNTYRLNGSEKSVIINYTDERITAEGMVIEPLSAAVK